LGDALSKRNRDRFESRHMGMPKLKDILDVLEDMAPASLAEDWDNPGLQVGDFSWEIKKILFSLNPTLEAVKAASRKKAQMLLTHHPLIFRPLFHVNQATFPGNVIFEAYRRGISVVSVHTNLDAAPGGINDMLAHLFGLQDVDVLAKGTGSHGDRVGLGRIGLLPSPVSLAAMIKSVKAALGIKTVRVVGRKRGVVKTVALVGGSGGSMVSVAAARGADLLITGDVSHHEALAAKDLGLSVIDGGHFHTEKAALWLFAEHFRNRIEELGWRVRIDRFEDEKDPMGFE
jgi:dinuclear metal center YbgI/SA1388 family protein